MNKAKFVAQISVVDPDTKGDIELMLYKHENGGMFAIDLSFLDQNLGDKWTIPDPFSDTRSKVELLN